jgi:flagellar biosynthetic protein FlhB
MAAGSLAATGVLVVTGSLVMGRFGFAIADALKRMGQTPLRDLRPEELTTFAIGGGTLLLLTAGPIALAAAAAAVLGTVVQSGLTLSTSPLKIDWNRLSPANGIRRLAPSRSGIDMLKALLTGSVLAVLAWRIGKDLAADSTRLLLAGSFGAAERGWSEGVRLLWQAGFALLAIGAIDFGVQRWRLRSSLKMTRQEVRDEARSTEGNPEVKTRVRRVQREMARRRMLHAVPRAAVVVTNPSHYAVALEYRREKASAPVIVAKGRDLVAARIREIARQHSVPIVENPPLARALFKECEIGDVIPAPLFGAVAEVLAYLIRIKQLVL